MRYCFSRIAACIIGLAAGSLILKIELSFASGALMVLWLTLMYIICRPLMQIILLPLNMFLLGILTIAADALLICWAAAWTPSIALSYLEAILIAALIGFCMLPYGHAKRKRLIGNSKTS